MKIRSGFVSNSSTSSFVLEAKGRFSTVKDVAKYIMTSTVNIMPPSTSSFKKELFTLEKCKDADTPVFFNAFGEKTYIRKIDDKIVLVTTENYNLDSLHENSIKDKLPIEFFSQFDYVDEYGDKITHEYKELDDFYKIFNDFLILEHDFFGKHTYLDEVCPKCRNYRGYILRNGQTICDCEVEKVINLRKRADKIKKIEGKEIK